MGRRRRLRGFRGRVLGFAALLLVGVTGGGLLLQRAILLEQLDRDISRSLDQERAELAALADGRDPATGEPFDGDVEAIFTTFLSRNVPAPGEAFLTFVDGRPYQRTVAPLRLDEQPTLVERWGGLTRGERGEISTEAGPVRFLAVPLTGPDGPAGVFVVAHFVDADRNAIDAQLRVQAAVVLGAVAVAMGIAWFTAGRLLRPLHEVTDAARTITETDLSQRIPVEGDDEVAELATTFNSMLARLEGAFAAQRSFVDDAGHELRTPITVIMGQLELMGDDPDDRERTLAIVDDELQRMARIVEDLLLLAKAEQGDFVQLEEVELSDLTTELLMKARTLGDRDWQLDACAVGSVALDPQRVTQAVLNLARNAVEHTEPGTEVALGSARDHGELRIWVRDAGAGVDPDEREAIFDRFRRGGRGRRSSDGAGLGLSIVRAVARGHGGDVVLAGPETPGATFTLVLPDVAEGRDAGDPAPQDPASPDTTVARPAGGPPPPAHRSLPPPPGTPPAAPSDPTEEIDPWPAS